MKAIVNTGPGLLAMLEMPLPQPGLGQVRIRTAVCGICHTDLELIAGWKRTGFPTIPGHEWAGYVDASGSDVDPTLVGKPCVAENVLADGGEVGFEHSGGYGHYLLTEAANLYILPVDFPIMVAALIEPLAVVIRAFRKVRLADCQRVLISGDGPVGLLALMVLRHAGIKQITIIGGREDRLALARSLGAVETFNFLRLGADLIPAVQQRVGSDFPVIIEMSGSPVALDTALQLVAREGQLILVGDYGTARADFPWNLILLRELELVGSNASAGAWDEAVRLAVDERLPLQQLISHSFPAEQFNVAFDLVRSQRDDVVKVMLRW